MQTSPRTLQLAPLAANEFKENLPPCEQTPSDKTAYPSNSRPIKPFFPGSGKAKAQIAPISKNTTSRCEPLRGQDVFFSSETNSAIPMDISSDGRGGQDDSCSSSYYMFPLNTPQQPCLDFYEPTDPFADAILFDEQYAFRRRRIIRNANKSTIAFHLPTGCQDFQGNQGV